MRCARIRMWHSAAHKSLYAFLRLLRATSVTSWQSDCKPRILRASTTIPANVKCTHMAERMPPLSLSRALYNFSLFINLSLLLSRATVVGVFHALVTTGGKFPDGTDNITLGGYFPQNHLRGSHVLFLASFSDNDATLSQFYALIVLLESFIESLTVVLPFYPTATSKALV